METLSELLSTKTVWELPTEQPTFAIGLSFIFLAYGLHGRIETAYQRVRASHAWRAVQKNKRVDVTEYPSLKEAFGIRGKWDAARIVAVLLLAFSAVSWVLELSLGIYHIDGTTDLLTQPPTVTKFANSTWKVRLMEEVNPEYTGDWRGQPNMYEFQAKSRYYVRNYTKFPWSDKMDTYFDGEIVVASWDPDDKPSLFYGSDDMVPVDDITCTGTEESTAEASVHRGGEEWGRVRECDEGPQKVGEAQPSQPAIILTSIGTGGVSVIVEEVGTHPSFLYSVWNATNATSTEISYTFHISSTVRLAEAVVTGIVNGETTGGGCFGLLRAYNRPDDDGEDSSTHDGLVTTRAKPFGEKPGDGTVDSLQDVDIIEGGVLMNAYALAAFACLLLLSIIGIIWSMCVKSSIEMDVYDRDELIRAISKQGQGEPDDLSEHADMRIYVQKERGGELNVIISESDDVHSGCRRFCLRRGEPAPSVHPVPVADTVSHALDDHGGAPLPLGRPRMYLGSIRTGMGRAYPGPRGNFRYPASLTASPVPSNLPTPIPSNVGSAAGTPAARMRRRRGVGVPSPCAASTVETPTPSNSGSAAGSPPGFLPSLGGGRGGGGGGGGGIGNFGVAGRGPSVLFESGITSGDEDGSSSGGVPDRDGRSEIEIGTGAFAPAYAPAFGGDGRGDIEMGSGSLPHPHTPAVGGDGIGDIKAGGDTSARPPAPAIGGNGSGDLEMGSLELEHPQKSQKSAASGGDWGGSSTQGGGTSSCGPQVDTAAGKRDISDGGIGGSADDALHLPPDRTTPPLSPGASPLPSRGLAAENTLGPPQLAQLTRTSEEGTGQAAV